jgi:hypothetical protein
MAPPKIFINIILNIIKKLTKLKNKGGERRASLVAIYHNF